MRNIAIALCAPALMILGVHAQAPQAQADPNQTVTVTACVQNEKDVLKGPAVEGNVGMGDEFVLTHSMVQTGSAAAPPSPAAPTSPAGSPGKIYRVTGDQEASLKPHLGHKVEITGTFKSEADARRELGAIGTSGKPPATPAEATAANTPEITIKSVKMVSETCGG